MPRRTARANARKSTVRPVVEHIYAQQKGPTGLFVRTIGIARARTKIGIVNLLYDMQRMIRLMRPAAAA
jgi:IS5 family transposase